MSSQCCNPAYYKGFAKVFLQLLEMAKLITVEKPQTAPVSFTWSLRNSNKVHFGFLHSHQCKHAHAHIHKELSSWQFLADMVFTCPAVSIGVFFASGQFSMGEGTAFFSPHSPAAAACLMRLCSAPGTSTQEQMEPISLLFSPKRDIHHTSHGITCVCQLPK